MAKCSKCGEEIFLDDFVDDEEVNGICEECYELDDTPTSNECE